MNPETLASRYQSILQRMARASDREAVLLAVSKSQPVEAIEELYRLGHRDFGENYVQELVAKAGELEKRGCSEIRWHFIGHLQTNKVKQLIPYLYAIHSVDSEKLAQELAKRWKAAGRAGRLPVFLEVNVSAETSKSGLISELAPALAEKISVLPELELQGLMCIPSYELDEAGLRAAFAGLRGLEAKCRPWSSGKLSMGMSSDFEIALQEGATHVRVGTALFGPRKQKN